MSAVEGGSVTRGSVDRAAKARAALTQRFLDQAGGDRVTAERLRRAYYVGLARRSARVRGEKAAARQAAREAALAAELAELGISVMSEAELLRLAQRKPRSRTDGFRI